MGSLADLTLGDIGRALTRYRPVAVTIALILLVIAVLPGPAFEELGPLPGVQGPVQVPAAATAASATSDTVAPAPSVDSSFGSSGSSSFGPTSSGSSSTSSFSTADSSPSSSFGSGDSSSDFGSSDSSGASPSFGTSDDSFGGSTGGDTSAQPLSIVAAAWASRTGGTPVGGTGVADNTLPVGKRIGQRDKLSFVRLSGSQTTLTLSPDTATSRTTTGEVAISACQITTRGWPEAVNQTFDQAPKFDEQACVVASVDPSGAFTFDFSLFPDRTDDRGFALVPTGPSVDYQINFRKQ